MSNLKQVDRRRRTGRRPAVSTPRSIRVDGRAIGRRIRARRLELDLTLQQLAGQIGFSDPNTIKNYEIHGRVPRVVPLLRLAAALGVSMEFLLTGRR